MIFVFASAIIAGCMWLVPARIGQGRSTTDAPRGSLKPIDRPFEADELFSLLDSDQDGVVTREDVRKAFKVHGVSNLAMASASVRRLGGSNNTNRLPLMMESESPRILTAVLEGAIGSSSMLASSAAQVPTNTLSGSLTHTMTSTTTQSTFQELVSSSTLTTNTDTDTDTSSTSLTSTSATSPPSSTWASSTTLTTMSGSATSYTGTSNSDTSTTTLTTISVISTASTTLSGSATSSTGSSLTVRPTTATLTGTAALSGTTVASTTGMNSEGSDGTAVIRSDMTIAGVDFTALDANPTLKAAFEAECQKTIASTAGTLPENVQVSLSSGSVRVDYAITLPVGASALARASLGTATAASGDLATNLVVALGAVPGIENVVSGDLAVDTLSPLTVEVVTTKQVPTVAPIVGASEEDRTASAGSQLAAIGTLVGFGAVLCICTLGYRMYRKGHYSTKAMQGSAAVDLANMGESQPGDEGDAAGIALEELQDDDMANEVEDASIEANLKPLNECIPGEFDDDDSPGEEGSEALAKEAHTEDDLVIEVSDVSVDDHRSNDSIEEDIKPLNVCIPGEFDEDNSSGEEGSEALAKEAHTEDDLVIKVSDVSVDDHRSNDSIEEIPTPM